MELYSRYDKVSVPALRSSIRYNGTTLSCVTEIKPRVNFLEVDKQKGSTVLSCGHFLASSIWWHGWNNKCTWDISRELWLVCCRVKTWSVLCLFFKSKIAEFKMWRGKFSKTKDVFHIFLNVWNINLNTNYDWYESNLLVNSGLVSADGEIFAF